MDLDHPTKTEPDLNTAEAQHNPPIESPSESTITTPQTVKRRRKRYLNPPIERSSIDQRISEDVLTLVSGSWMIPKSCISCRERRLFCDRKQPCRQCIMKGSQCIRQSGLTPAKGFRRRGWDSETNKRARVDGGEKGPKTTQQDTSDSEPQDQRQAPTPAVSVNSPYTPFSSQATTPTKESPAQLIRPPSPLPTEPVASLIPTTPTSSPIKGDVTLMTRITISREAKRIYESEAPTLALFLKQVRKKWELAPTERITHVQVMITTKRDTDPTPTTQAIHVNLEKPSQWDLVMDLARLHDKTGVVIVEVN